MSNSIHLQGIGQHTAKPAGELAVGDVTVWNYGYASRVVSVERVSKMFVVAGLVSTDKRSDGKVWPRRMKIDRLVAVEAR